MKKILTALFSPKTSLVLLLVFTVSIAVATFVEDKYDTNTAQLLIYKSWWFEAVIALMALNFIGNLRRYHFFTWGKLGGLIFHVGFIVLIIGAGITRYFGFEGTMHIRQGESAASIYTLDNFLQVEVTDAKGAVKQDHALVVGASGNPSFRYKIKSSSGEPVEVSFNRILRNAEEVVREGVPGGIDMIGLQIAAGNTSQGVYLKKGERIVSGGVAIAFGDTLHENDINITEQAGKLLANSKQVLLSRPMNEAGADSTVSGNSLEVREQMMYRYGDIVFTSAGFFPQAELDFQKNSGTEEGIDVLTVNVTYKGQTQKLNLLGVSVPEDPAKQVSFGDVKVNIRYGAKEIPLPFSVKLNRFELDRYGGSMSPSSFASEVTVIDSSNGKQFDKRIFMNHVLDYKGYRFFQSSYDTDEKGTILSVNHDFWGTWISYFSYFLLMVGFVIVMFSKHSRYHFLTAAIRKIREKRKSGLLMLCLLAGMGSAIAQHKENHVIARPEAEKFGRVLVQTFDGRIEPLHTLAYDAIHKISKKDQFKKDDGESLDAMQLVIDLLADPAYWKQQPIIYVKEKAVADVLGIEGRYAAFNDFMDAKGQYKLSSLVEEAFRKSQSQQNKFDKELIKVDERVNLFFMMLQGSMIKIFPVDNNSRTWVDWTDSVAHKPLEGAITMINMDLKLKDFNFGNILTVYLQELMSGAHSGSFERADKVLGYIRDIQKNNVLAPTFPSEAKITAEIKYNKQGIFNKLKGYYAMIGLILLIVAFTDNVRKKSSVWLNRLQWVCIGLLAAAFVYHSYGMGMRWYLSGHAPWSNGYEALLLVAWSTVLAGFFFIRSSKIIQAATAFLASMILMTAGHSNYDPQLTNLQPVLQSYWLVIHVAVITVSYGFLALGCMLGVINMFLYLFRSKHNGVRSSLLISELTFINEKNLQIGLFLATLGTFLGGVWASESWGRYWGWDAKETWALVIIIVYSIVVHLRLVPHLRGLYIFNVSSIVAFGSVLMTFIGVNYYLSKGLHSYASDDKSVFPTWGWITILAFIALMVAAGIKERMYRKHHGEELH